MATCFYNTIGNNIVMCHMSRRSLSHECLMMSLSFVHKKMNNDDRHHIKTQMKLIFADNMKCKRSSFYEYVRKQINRLVILNSLSDSDDLWEWSYDYFKKTTTDYVSILSNRK